MSRDRDEQAMALPDDVLANVDRVVCAILAARYPGTSWAARPTIDRDDDRKDGDHA